MATVYLALGGNVGESGQHIERAVRLLDGFLGSLQCAPLYTSRAVGYEDQADFINTAVCGRTTLSPQNLLKLVKEIEQKVGRTASFRWGPREIDIDIIFYDDVVLDVPDLTIPHAQFAERDFVLQPLVDLDPDLVDPKTKHSLRELLGNLPAEKRSIISKKSA